MFDTKKSKVLADQLDVDVTLVERGWDGLDGLGFGVLLTPHEFSAHALVVRLETKEFF
jgi:hypothetical protein